MKNNYSIYFMFVLVFLLIITNSCKKKLTGPVPILTTSDVSNITGTSSNTGGNITNDGGSTVTARGVCWSTDISPTISDNKTNDGTGAGSFISAIKDLRANTTYYVRAYATNGFGCGYGSALSFKTGAPTIPQVITSVVSAITLTTANCGGEIIQDGGSLIISRGVCWSSLGMPTISDSKTINGSGLGSFTSVIAGLSPYTNYTIRAYATNSAGTSYGNSYWIKTNSPPPTLPVLTTQNPNGGPISDTSAISGGIITSDGYSPITVSGICWSTNPNPTTASSHTTNGASIGYFMNPITNLTPFTTYYVRAYATNIIGTGYGDEISFRTAPLSIGKNYQGGKIFFYLGVGQVGYDPNVPHGLIAAPSDISIYSFSWYNGTYSTTGATGTSIGSGNSNTIAIVANQGSFNYAAKACSDFTFGGYSDWYLPSKDELNMLFINRTAIGGFDLSIGIYWSSSESNNNNAWCQEFYNNGDTGSNDKAWGRHVRAIRSF